MKVIFFCPHWGSESMTFADFLNQCKEAGYDGIEMALPTENSEACDQLIGQVRESGLLYILLHFETNETDFEKHLAQYTRRIEVLARYGPVLINSQTGRDFFSMEQNLLILQRAHEVSDRTGIQIVHETHRKKFSFAAHVVKPFLEQDEQLRLCADFSHWCNVAESLLEDQDEAVELALSRADHIHARVGFEEGPQVADPRVPEWKYALDRHISWWDKVVKRASAEGREIFTITPEFGPYPYMTILPFSRQPITSQWDVNQYMMNLLRDRYQNEF